MAWTAPSTWTVGQVLTAAAMNQQLRDNMIDLDRRTTATGATVATSQTTTSASSVDLTTVGPAVTVTIGSTGRAMVSLYCAMNNSVSGDVVFMGFALTGANTVATSDAQSLAFTSPTAGGGIRFGAAWLMQGLTAGSTTFTAKYRISVGGTGTWQDRQIIVTPLGS